MNELDKSILGVIQVGFPVESHPYASIAQSVGSDETSVINAVQGLRDAGDIRRIGASFDSYHLGYVSSLCAMAQEDASKLEDTIKILNSYLGVTHNYERNDRYNLWFTFICPSWEELNKNLAEIAKRSGCEDIITLPAKKLFKIRVDFDMTGKRALRSEAPKAQIPSETPVVALDDVDRALIRIIQADLGASATPYKDVAEKLEISEEEVISRISRLKDAGAIRRLGAIVRHRKLGFTYNGMGVWNVPDEHVLEAGAIMASFNSVSHCYERPRADTWPSNMYSMIHGTSKEACENTAKEIAHALDEAQIPYTFVRMLYSSRELKKTSMKYFA